MSNQSANIARPGSRTTTHFHPSGRSTASSTCAVGAGRPIAESGLQWSSESTLGASELVRRHRHHQIHHHHYYHHHAAVDTTAQQRSLSSAGSKGSRSSRGVNGSAATTAVVGSGRSKDDFMLSSKEYRQPRRPQIESLSDSEEAGDVCLYCSEWLSRALLCSCQVPSSSTNSSPSQSAGLAGQFEAGKVAALRRPGSVERPASQH